MHESSFNEMKSFLDGLDPKADLNVLDVGSLQTDPKHKTYRTLCKKKAWTYKGLDLVDGPNVDIISKRPYDWPLKDAIFDVVISGQVLEHCFNPHSWVKEIHRILKKGGSVCIIAPSAGKIHHPPDYWRILPHGMFWLLKSTLFFKVQVAQSIIPPWFDVMGTGRK